MGEAIIRQEAHGRPTTGGGVKLAIVGSVLLAGNREAQCIIEQALDEWRPDVVISGGAKGIDSMAVAEARKRGIVCVEHLPKTREWATGFAPRNRLIAQDCDALVRIVAQGAKTYGSGWTRDRAEEMGKPTQQFVVILA